MPILRVTDDEQQTIAEALRRMAAGMEQAAAPVEKEETEWCRCGHSRANHDAHGACFGDRAECHCNKLEPSPGVRRVAEQLRRDASACRKLADRVEDTSADAPAEV